jgi:hypothetical protein
MSIDHAPIGVDGRSNGFFKNFVEWNYILNRKNRSFYFLEDILLLAHMIYTNLRERDV